jgi:urease subunit gamma/beta
MRLTQTELDRVTIFSVAEMARRRRARGLRLNYPEAAALIADEMMESARDGATYEAVKALGESVLTAADVLPGVPALLTGLRCEPLFDDGPRLIVLGRPIASDADDDLPGAVELASEPLTINAARDAITLTVRNASEHVVNVSSHYHFYEVNARLEFERPLAWGRHLDIQAGRSLIWRPGESRDVVLVAFAGAGIVDGFRGMPPPDATPAVTSLATPGPSSPQASGR